MASKRTLSDGVGALLEHKRLKSEGDAVVEDIGSPGCAQPAAVAREAAASTAAAGTGAREPVPVPGITGCIGESLGLAPGARLQVLWTLEEGDGEAASATQVWWDCELQPWDGHTHELVDEGPEEEDEEEEHGRGTEEGAPELQATIAASLMSMGAGSAGAAKAGQEEDEVEEGRCGDDSARETAPTATPVSEAVPNSAMSIRALSATSPAAAASAAASSSAVVAAAAGAGAGGAAAAATKTTLAPGLAGGADGAASAVVKLESQSKPQQTQPEPGHEPAQDRTRVAVRVLRYAARPPDFPDPEEVRVCFVGTDALLDLDANDTMQWRAAVDEDATEMTIDDMVGLTMAGSWKKIMATGSAGGAADQASKLRVASVMRVASDRVRAALREELRVKAAAGNRRVEVADVHAAIASVEPFLRELRESLREGTERNMLNY